MSPESILESKRKSGNQNTSMEKTETFLELVNRNIPGKSLNGRPVLQPDASLYKKFKKRELLKASAKKGDFTKALEKGEQQEIVKDFTNTVLLKKNVPSQLSNKNLFLTSRHAFYPSTSPKDLKRTENSPTSRLASMNSTQGPVGDYNYTTLKREKKSLVMSSRMSPSLSQTRLDREFSLKKLRNSAAPATTDLSFEAASR